MKTVKELVKIGESQICAFKDFQDREQGGMTVRDFDVWLGGYISGLSHYWGLKNKGILEEDFAADLFQVARGMEMGDTAKSLGINGVDREEIVTFNVSKK